MHLYSHVPNVRAFTHISVHYAWTHMDAQAEHIKMPLTHVHTYIKTHVCTRVCPHNSLTTHCCTRLNTPAHLCTHTHARSYAPTCQLILIHEGTWTHVLSHRNVHLYGCMHTLTEVLICAPARPQRAWPGWALSHRSTSLLVGYNLSLELTR